MEAQYTEYRLPKMIESLYDMQEPREKAILDELLRLRQELKVLKLDKSTYVKSQDVIKIYDQVITQACALEEYRTTDSDVDKSGRVNRVLEDCLQLLSLFFMTVGRNDEAPAVFSLLLTIRRLLDHLTEAMFFTAKDLESIGHKLENSRKNLQNTTTPFPQHLVNTVDQRITACLDILHRLRTSLNEVSPSLTPIHERLISILRSLSAANTRSTFRACEVSDLRNQLVEIKSSMVDGQFPSTEKTSAAGQQVLIDLLDRCFLWTDIVMDKKGQINPRFKQTYEHLADIRNQLERLSLTQAWSLRETDLHSFSRQLDKVDDSRCHGNFEDAEGEPADLHTQRTLLYLIRRSYAYIYLLTVGSEPVSEALTPIYNQLQTLRRCLIEVRGSGGVSSARELYPYTMKLSSIESMRSDGKFKVGNDVPEGQENLTALLDECVSIQADLRQEAEIQRGPQTDSHE